MGHKRIARIRNGGWTAARQLHFLDVLAATRSVSKAAVAAGMSRESAYCLRVPRDGGLFAALWDRVFAVASSSVSEGHI